MKATWTSWGTRERKRTDEVAPAPRNGNRLISKRTWCIILFLAATIAALGIVVILVISEEAMETAPRPPDQRLALHPAAHPDPRR